MQVWRNTYKAFATPIRDINNYWFDLDKLANFYKPFSVPFNYWITEPSKKFWLDYAVR